MGVHGLWELLAPVGRRVSVETLAGKRVAVDASIWMVQFMRAMRDDSGEMVRDAHLLGFLRRICKLFYLRVRPVFVFDGATPALKRRTLAARRRHRDAAQAKVRKTAEKLLLSQLKARKLEELAEQIRSDRANHDATVNQVGSSRGGESETTNKEQNQSGDANNSEGPVASINQEKMDEMLAASLAAEEEKSFTEGMEHHFTSVPFQEGAEIDEDDDDEEMIFPITTGDIDPAVLASLPPSMKLDLLVQMRERVMAENGQKYQKIKKEPAKFSELQIQSYLKTVAFRREIDQVQKCAAGKGVGGVQTSKIASEANREFIFSSSFTGDKQMLAQRGGKEQDCDTVRPRKEINSAAFRSNSASSSRTVKPPNSEPLKDFGPDVETYRDDRGRIRVSRVRAMGIRMTRDIQRNLDFIKENEQVKSREQTNAHKGSTQNEEPPTFPEHLFETAELRRSCSFDENSTDSPSDNLQTSSLVGESGSISEKLHPGYKETIEISFMDDQNVVEDNDEEIFLELASGMASKVFVDDDHLAKKTEESDDSECIWEEGVIERETVDMKVDETDRKSSLPENCTDDEVEWEEGDCYVPEDPSSSKGNPCKVPKGDLEEEALIQEAIMRSLNDFDNQTSETVITDDLQPSIEERFLQSADDVPKTSGALGRAYSHPEVGIVKQANEETRIGISFNENDVMHDVGVPGAAGQENEKQAQHVNNDSHVDIQTTHVLESLPLHNKSISNLTEKVSDSSKDNASDVIVSTTRSPEEPVDAGKSINQNNINYDKSKCCNDVASVGESLKSTQKNLLIDDLVADSAPQNENVNQWDPEFSASNIHNVLLGENYENHSMSEMYLDKELSLLRQEQINLGNERRKRESHAESVSSEMFAECQELLQMFGLPYIIAPTEAEAQCAYMEMSNLVDGVVTDDSDVFLFGARHVYKNIFDDRKYVETYFMKDIESELGLTRQQLIRMALLLGSDYTEGVSGIGIVNAIEVVHAFPEEDGLQKFKEWIESPDPSILGKLDTETGNRSKKRKAGRNASDGKEKGLEPDSVQDSDDKQPSNGNERIKETFMSRHRNVSKNWHIPSTFPSDSVISAYMSPQVDNSTEPFSWGRPDLGLLRKLCWERFGWGKEKADELLLPVLREYNKHETQLRMEAFYSFNERFAKIRSKRIKKAIKGITGKSFPDTDEPNQDNPSTSKTSKKKEESSSTSSRGRRKTNTNAGLGILKGQENNKIGSQGASDEDSLERHATNYKSEGMAVRRSHRKRKQVTYVEDGNEADDNDVPFHQDGKNGSSQAAADMDMTGQDTQSNFVLHDTSEPTEPGINEDFQGFELHEDHLTDSVPKDYLFSGGGFCTEEGDEQDPTGDATGAEMEHGTNDAFGGIDVIPDGGRGKSASTTVAGTDDANMEAEGQSSSQRLKAGRGLSAMPTLTKRRRKS
ncbi:hypothetical protein QOZ80_3BG0290070 [Eleusine coracana subsp. coracana]|nr:hypothetical protein QOZ80_3BG0290070 [Eleusine coracana subsp. coracana]